MDRTAVWPHDEDYIRPIIATAYLTLLPMMAVFVVLRTPSSLEKLRSLSVVRILILATMVDSFIFVWGSAVLLFGVGSSYSGAACSVGILLCIFAYATSKVFIYLFLMERVYLVYSFTSAGRVSRWKSPWYRVSACFTALWIGVAVAMIVGRISFLRQNDNACVIGLKLYATVPMLVVDAIVNCVLTGAFVIPIARSKFHKARKLARNSCIAAVAALLTSFANIVVLSVQHGHQLSFVCLGSCGLDVAINSAIIFFITRGDRDGGAETSDLTSMGNNLEANRRGSTINRIGATSGCKPGFCGVSVSSEVVQTEEKRLEDAYIPIRQGWRGSGSGDHLMLSKASPRLEDLIEAENSTPVVHKIAFADSDDSSSVDESKGAEQV